VDASSRVSGTNSVSSGLVLQHTVQLFAWPSVLSAPFLALYAPDSGEVIPLKLEKPQQSVAANMQNYFELSTKQNVQLVRQFCDLCTVYAPLLSAPHL